MEKYIVKINNNVISKHDEEGQVKIKKRYLAIGGTILAIGIAGFLASFITFLVLFMSFKTDESMTAWLVAIPFIILFVSGAVVTRIGDMLLTQDYDATIYKKKSKDKNEDNKNK